MVDNTVNISENGSFDDSIFVENSILVQETGYNEQLTITEKNCEDYTVWNSENVNKSIDNGAVKYTLILDSLSKQTQSYTTRLVPCKVGQYVIISGDFKTDATSKSFQFGIHCYNSSGVWLRTIFQNITLTSSFTTYSTGIIELPLDTYNIRPNLRANGPVAGTSYWIDNMSVLSLSGADSLSIKNTVSVSEGFTPRNLLPADVASCTDVSGGVSAFGSFNSITLTSDTTQYYKGSRSLKVVTSGLSPNEGAYYNNPVDSNTQYTFSAWIKSLGSMRLYIWEFDSNNVHTNTINTQTVTLNGSWQRISLTVTSSATTKYFRIMVLTQTNQAITFYVDCLQLELGNVATPWMGGNLLSYNQQTVETDLTGMGCNGPVSMSRDTTVSYKGSASFKVLNNTSGWTSIWVNTIPVKGDKIYLFQVMIKSTSKNQTITPYVTFYNSQGTSINTQWGSNFPIINGWQLLSVVVKAPSDAVQCTCLAGRTPQNGDITWWDEAWLIEYPIDDISIQNQLTIKEEQGNLLNPNIATATKAFGTLLGFYSAHATLTHVSDGLQVVTNGTNNYEGIYTAAVDTTVPYGSTTTTTFKFQGNAGDPYRITLFRKDYSLSAQILGTFTGEIETKSLTLLIKPDQNNIILAFDTGTNIKATTFKIFSIQTEVGSVATEWKYPSIGTVNDKPTVKATVPVIDSLNRNVVSPNIAKCCFNRTTLGFSSYRGSVLSSDQNGLKVITDNSNPPYCGVWFISNSSNGNYTFSTLVKASQGTRMFLWTYYGTGIMSNTYYWNASGEWEWVSLTGLVDNHGRFYIGTYNIADTFYVQKIQVEEGSVATDWVFPGAVDDLNVKATVPVEEKQGNLCTPNQALGTDISNNTAGIQVWGYDNVSQSSTDYAWQGSRSIKVIIGSTNNGGAGMNEASRVQVYSGQKITASAYVLGDNVPVRITMYHYNDLGKFVSSFTSGYITTNLSGFQRITFSYTVPNNGFIGFYIATSNTNCIFYIDGLQLEYGDLTDWKYPSIGPIKEVPSIKNNLAISDINLSEEENVHLQNLLPVYDNNGNVIEVAKIQANIPIPENYEGTDDISIESTIPVQEFSNPIVEAVFNKINVPATDNGIMEDFMQIQNNLEVEDEGESEEIPVIQTTVEVSENISGLDKIHGWVIDIISDLNTGKGKIMTLIADRAKTLTMRIRR